MTHRLRTSLRLAALVVAALLAALVGVACAPVNALNALTSDSRHRLSADVAYAAGERHKLDIYRPVRAAPAGGWPVVVFFYGGSWTHGARKDYKFIGAALASRGVLTLVADYRLYPDVRYPEFLDDCAAALAWALDHAAELGGNPKRVFAMGHDAGAYNAAMLALDPRWLASTGHTTGELAGWIGLAGAYDFQPLTNRDTQAVFFHPNYPPHSQPLEFANAKAPPTFLGAPVDDTVVDPLRNTIALDKKLKAAGVPTTLKMYSGVSHMTLLASVSRPLRFLAPTLDDIVTFIETTPPRH